MFTFEALQESHLVISQMLKNFFVSDFGFSTICPKICGSIKEGKMFVSFEECPSSAPHTPCVD